MPTCLRSLRSLRPWGPLYFCRKSYTSFWIPVLFVGKKSKQRNVCRQDYGFTADDWPLMDHGFKARFEEPAVKGWHRFFPMVNRFGLTGKWFKTCLRKLFWKRRCLLTHQIRRKYRFRYLMIWRMVWGCFLKLQTRLINRMTSSLMFTNALMSFFKMVHMRFTMHLSSRCSRTICPCS